MNINYPNGMIPCPPYFEGRLIVQLGNESVDLMEAPNHSVWAEAFSSGEINWELGWRRLWDEAGLSLGTGSDYSPDRVAIEVQAYFANNQMGSIGALVDCEFDDADELDAAARRLFARVCGSDEVVDGCLGLVTDSDDVKARPSLTLLVSGPGGGAEAAMIIRQALSRLDVNAGVSIRVIRNGAVGVVKIPFLPELYMKVRHPSFGVRWDVWYALARNAPSFEWGSACLLWCSSVIQAVLDLKDEAGIMIDDVYFDYMRVIPLSQKHTRSLLVNEPLSIGRGFSMNVFDFLYGNWDA